MHAERPSHTPMSPSSLPEGMFHMTTAILQLSHQRGAGVDRRPGMARWRSGLSSAVEACPISLTARRACLPASTSSCGAGPGCLGTASMWSPPDQRRPERRARRLRAPADQSGARVLGGGRSAPRRLSRWDPRLRARGRRRGGSSTRIRSGGMSSAQSAWSREHARAAPAWIADRPGSLSRAARTRRPSRPGNRAHRPPAPARGPAGRDGRAAWP